MATPTDLTTELRGILAATAEARPSRSVLASRLRELAHRVAEDEDDEPHPDLPVKRGEWTLWITKDRATRWGYSLHNPQGGSGGSRSYTSAKAAFHAATSRVLWKGAMRFFMVVAKWDTNQGEYVVTKSAWVDIPDQGEKGHGVLIPTPKLGSDVADRVASRVSAVRQAGTGDMKTSVKGAQQWLLFLESYVNKATAELKSKKEPGPAMSALVAHVNDMQHEDWHDHWYR